MTFIIVIVWLLLSFIFPSQSYAVGCTYPAQILDLTNWKQTLPTGSQGSPTEIRQPALATFIHQTFFHPNPACDGVVFRAPTDGVTTSGSNYPRSELREMINNGTANASWSNTSGKHTMFIDQAITAVPQIKKHVVAGQIHDASSDVIVIRLEFPKLFVDIGGAQGAILDPNYTLGKRFTVQIVAENGKVDVYYNGSATPAHTLNQSFSNAYFKAGAYTQSNCQPAPREGSSCGSGNYGEVVIYGLRVDHGAGLIPTPPPGGATIPAELPFPTQSAVTPVSTTSAPTPTPSDTPTPTPTPGPRFAECNSCGYCLEKPAPDGVDECMKCLYPGLTPEDSLRVDPDTGKAASAVKGKYYTQLGCIDTGTDSFSTPQAAGAVLNFFMTRLMFPITGVLALLSLIYGSFLLVTAQDNPEQIQRGKLWVVGSVIGALFVFSAVLLVQTVGKDLLKIPGIN